MSKQMPWKSLVQCFSFVLCLVVLATYLTLIADKEGAVASQEFYSREELERAFHQRDQALEVLLSEITSLGKRLAILEEK